MLTSQILPSISAFKILGNTSDFLAWMKENHPNENVNELLDGYKFSLECCLNSFIDGICGDEHLELESDFLFMSALSELIQLHKMKSTCEKVILLKNIKPIFKAVLKSNTYEELDKNCKIFNERISWRFDLIKERHIVFAKADKLEESLAHEFWIMAYLQTYLVQIKNDGPLANQSHPFNTDWKPKDRLITYLNGYKFAIQFIWNRILGNEKFNHTRLVKMHEADTWRDYKYINESPSDNLSDVLNQRFNLHEQTCFDSYFYWIQKEITEPIKEERAIEVYSIDRQFHFDSTDYNKDDLFNDLLESSDLKYSRDISSDEELDELLYWYPIEVVDARKSRLHVGIPAFNTLLAGTVTLFNVEESSFDKVIVAKFRHPIDPDGSRNEYSYGVLVDSKSAAGHYSSGWVIYQDACGDYSGFSGWEHRSAEKLIKKFLDEDKIELREAKVSLDEFSRYTNQSVRTQDVLDLHNENEILNQHLIDAKSILFELFVYHVFVRYYGDKKDFEGDAYKIMFSVDKNSPEGEKDVVVQSPNEVKLIECKLNPQTCNWSSVISKLEKKSKAYVGRKVSVELWFWHEPHTQTKSILDNARVCGEPINYVVLSRQSKTPILKGVDTSKLSRIMKGEKTTKFIEPHPIWDSIQNAGSFSDFKKYIIPELYIKPSVHEDIRGDIDTIKNLLEHSYFQYNFTDIALTHAVIVLEKALKIRYREINNRGFRGNLKSLINWFFERDYFETYNSMVLHQLRNIRNGKVHEEKPTLGGLIFLSKTKTPVILINDTYEDPELRRRRKTQVSTLQSELDNLLKDGGILVTSSEKAIIERVEVVFINNKFEPHRLSLIVLPIYDPEIYFDQDNVVANCPTIELILTDWLIENNRFTAVEVEGNTKVVLHPIVKAVNREKFSNWLKECILNSSLKRLNDMGANRAVDKVFLKELDLLHKC